MKYATRTNLITVLFGVSLFLCVALFRGYALGQNISIFFVLGLLLLSLGFGVWLFIIKRNC